MSFINNFRLHYHIKNLDNLINSEDFDQFFLYLLSLKKNEKIFFQLSLKYASKVINKSQNDFFDKKIIWINSYMKEDLDYLQKFLLFYLGNKKYLSENNPNYLDEIDKIMIQKEEINFNTLVNQSYFFQWMILNNNNLKYNFIINEIPFFSTKDNFNFTKPNLTQSYIFLMNDPYIVYEKIKKIHNNDQEVARNIFLNLDNNPIQSSHGQTNFLLSKKGWHTNTQSWTDPNVLNSLRGKVVLQKDLINQPYETLSSIILHLIQSGVTLDLNYDLIEDFIKNNTNDINLNSNLSQKEKKFIDKYVSDIYLNHDL